MPAPVAQLPLCVRVADGIAQVATSQRAAIEASSLSARLTVASRIGICFPLPKYRPRFGSSVPHG